MFLISLGMLDLAEPVVSGAPSSTFSPSRTIQTVKFLSRSEPFYGHLKGWLSFYTVTLAHPITEAQRDLHNRLQGPVYRPRRSNDGRTIDDHEFYIMMVNLPDATGSYNAQYGWVQELRQADGEQGCEAGTTVQDAFFYTKWLSRDAEEKMKRALPGVEYSWDDELREIGALSAKEEHVDLVCIAFGRHHKP